MVLLSFGASIGPEMVLGYFISNNKSLYGFKLFYCFFICFLQNLPKRVPQTPIGRILPAQNPFGQLGSLLLRKMPNMTTMPSCLNKIAIFGSTAVHVKILLKTNISKNLCILKAASCQRLNAQIIPAHCFKRHKKAYK